MKTALFTPHKIVFRHVCRALKNCDMKYQTREYPIGYTVMVSEWNYNSVRTLSKSIIKKLSEKGLI